MYKIPEDLQYFQLDSLDIGYGVDIKLPSCTIEYEVAKQNGYYLRKSEWTENDAIFKALGIDSPRSFVINIVGYMCDGLFPEMKTQEDLLKVIVALDKECIKKFGNKNEQSEFKDGDYISIMHNDELLWIMIFKQRSDNTIYRYANYSNTTKNLCLDEDGYTTLSSSKIMRYATKEEQKILDYELFKKGLVWNPTYKELVHINTTAIDSCETKPIFNIGDKVKIKPRTKSPEKYHPCYTLSMTKYAGRIAKVTNVTSTDFVVLDIDDGQSYWASEILEKVTEDEIVMTIDLAKDYMVNTLTSTTSRQTEIEKINLFPTKKHYKLNFSIN